MITISNVQTFNELIQLQQLWLDQEGIGDERLWNEEGERLHRKLLEYEPNNIEYKHYLAKALVYRAYTKKSVHMNYPEARNLLEESLNLEPSNLRSQYYLGIIAAIEKQWGRAYDYINFEIDRSILTRDEKIRAYCVQAVCYSKSGNISTAIQALQHAEMLSENISYVEIITAEVMVSEQAARLAHHNKRRNDSTDGTTRHEGPRISRYFEESQLVVITEDARKVITEFEADQLYESSERSVILDLRPEFSCSYTHPLRPHSSRFTVSPSEDNVQLQSKEAELLAFLMVNKKAVSSNFIRENLWPESKNNDLIKKYISIIRGKLQKYYKENIKTVLETGSEGYIWRDNRSFNIITIAGLYRHLK
ncbi:MAG TPA: winged helix-turn-helix domain-containing protein [Desulfosporosinus sp.]|nr:winged helix-turn-helix domain-containing protein [Desulfosporosinus sp.]